MKILIVILLLGSLAEAKEGLNPKAKCIGMPISNFLKIPPVGVELKIKDHSMFTTATWPDKSFCIIAVNFNDKGIITEEAETGNCDYIKEPNDTH